MCAETRWKPIYWTGSDCGWMFEVATWRQINPPKCSKDGDIISQTCSNWSPDGTLAQFVQTYKRVIKIIGYPPFLPPSLPPSWGTCWPYSFAVGKMSNNDTIHIRSSQYVNSITFLGLPYSWFTWEWHVSNSNTYTSNYTYGDIWRKLFVSHYSEFGKNSRY